MTKKGRSLPVPPSARRRLEEGSGSGPLVADQMAMAAAGGKIQEFMDSALPEGEHARKLAGMMMGMTGMLSGMPQGASPDDLRGPHNPAAGAEDRTGASEDPPPEVYKAVGEADIGSLIDILKKEHARRTGEEVSARPEAGESDAAASPDRELLDSLMRISSEQNLSPDWIMMRALKLYIAEYEKTGRL